MKAKENIYLNADRSKAVTEDSEDQAFLLAAKGTEIPDAAAKKYGIEDGKIAGKKAASKKSNKSKKAAENKSKK